MSNVDRKDRRHKPEGDDGHRTPFERDRDAILYTTAFRRLAGVTQVVSPTEGQVYHNRLTHTIEVAQIARRLAERIAQKQTDLANQYSLDADVVETAALAHDLGHPPFGHVAEKELNELVQKSDVIDGYEGNAQSFRIISKLAVRNDSPGLNLTRASLNASLKYPWCQKKTNGNKQKHKKWGAYTTEDDDFVFARGFHKPRDISKCLEAQLMDWADDIAYSIHDTEDFYRAGLIPLGVLARDAAFRDRFLLSAFERWKNDGIGTNYAEEDLAEEFHKVCETMPFDGPYEPSREQRAQLRGFTSNFIGRYITNTTLMDKATKAGVLLGIDDDVKMQVMMLKELTWQFVIKGPSLIGVQHGQRRALRSLFEIFANAVASNDQATWTVLPARNRSEMASLSRKYGPTIPEYERIRVAADSIAGMTDQQAILMFHRLTGISAGSVLDAIVI